jgi:hypothetical protein
MDKKQAMYAAIEKHGEQLKVIFGLDASVNPIELCKKLRKIERKAHRATTNLCSTNNLAGIEPGYNASRAWEQIETSEKDQDKFFAGVLRQVEKLLPPDMCPVMINHDPRGYALKIADRIMTLHNYNLHCDFGGYGIIAPDFSEGGR